jgi:hypothetical protein
VRRMLLKSLVTIAACVIVPAGSAKAGFVFGPQSSFGEPINSSYGEAPNCLSKNGLELYFDSNRPGGQGGWDIWVAKRAAVDQPWGAPANLGPIINSAGADSGATLSADGLELYFSSQDRAGGYGSFDIWVVKRTSLDAPWGTPENPGPQVNSTGTERAPCISPDSLELYFSSDRLGGYGGADICVCKRASREDRWGWPENPGSPINTASDECFPCLMPDGRVLVFSEGRQGDAPSRPGAGGKGYIWMATRATRSSAWGSLVSLAPAADANAFNSRPVLSPDGQTLYFSSETSNGSGAANGNICRMSILPVADFNADGVIDVADVRILVEHWGSTDLQYDIGPTPFGDGVVDLQDLQVLAACLQKSSTPAIATVADMAKRASVDSYTKYLRDDLFTHDGDERCFGPQHDLARDRIRQLFGSFGLQTTLHPFRYGDMTCYNVVGVLPGVSCPAEMYVLGAHYDTVEGAPGAWDNASGVAGVLEAARVLSQRACEATLVFIAFDREEQGLIGSIAYVNDHYMDHIRGMINLDAIGWRAYGPRSPDCNKISVYRASRQPRLLTDVASAMAAYGSLTGVVRPLYPAFYSSDHQPFDNIGIATAFLASYVTPEEMIYGWPNGVMHTPLDSVDQGFIDFTYGTQVTQGVIGTLGEKAILARARIVPDFTRDGVVNLEDCRRLLDHWRGSDLQFDIAPPPGGDGVVDEQDLSALLYYWSTGPIRLPSTD